MIYLQCNGVVGRPPKKKGRITVSELFSKEFGSRVSKKILFV